MVTVKIGSKGELIIPKKIREQYGLTAHTEATVLMKPDGIEVIPKKESIVEKWRKNPNRKNLEHLDLKAIYEQQYEEKFKDLLTS